MGTPVTLRMRAKCLCSGDLCHVILTSSPLFSSWPQQSWRDYSASCPINGPGPCSLLLSILPIVFPPPQGFSFDLPSKARHWLHFHPGRFSDSQLSGQCVWGGCAHVHVHARLCVPSYVCAYARTRVSMCSHVCMCVRMCMLVCMHVCTFVCLCAYVCTCMCTNVCVRGVCILT